MKRVSPLDSTNLEAIAKALGHTTIGLTGAEIGNILAQCRIADVDSCAAKWRRLFNALVEHQNSEQSANHVVGFIHKAMNPARWTSRHSEFEDLRSVLNPALAFVGLHLNACGEVRHGKAAKTLADAEARAGRLRMRLEDRRVHEDVLRFCSAELLQENHFHAVLEAVKSIANKMRALSGLTSDGSDLVTEAFSLGKRCKPTLAINTLKTDTEKGEQRGFVNLVVGVFGMVRNPAAHAEKIYWPIGEQDALDILSMVSLVHRKLDRARKL